MKGRIAFYIFVAALGVVDSFLLSRPNLLGKIGLIIYKYHYLRTFPRTLLTVTVVLSAAVLLAELVRFLVRKEVMKRNIGRIVLVFFILVSFALIIKTAIDFSTWTYGHTGFRFRYGAYLLPVVLVMIFSNTLFNLSWRIPLSSPLEAKKEQTLQNPQ